MSLYEPYVDVTLCASWCCACYRSIRSWLKSQGLWVTRTRANSVLRHLQSRSWAFSLCLISRLRHHRGGDEANNRSICIPMMPVRRRWQQANNACVVVKGTSCANIFFHISRCLPSARRFFHSEGSPPRKSTATSRHVATVVAPVLSL